MINKKNKGKLRDYMKSKYGKKAFDTNGNIKHEYLNIAYRNTNDKKIKKRITFAKNMEK
jgi:hypothetical protein